MYVVFQIGSKQYRAVIGQVLFIERINVDVGKEIEFNQILFFSDSGAVEIGYPYVKNSRVVAKVLNHGLYKKIEIIKFKRRKHYKKSQGHRQRFTKIEVIKAGVFKN